MRTTINMLKAKKKKKGGTESAKVIPASLGSFSFCV